MKNNALRILSGIVSSIILIGFLFYIFLFVNPIGIYKVNQLKWIPLFITALSSFVSGTINKETPPKWLVLLFIPLVFLKPFNYLYFPFILVVLALATLMLMATRKEKRYHKMAFSATAIIFIFHLFNQPLILQEEGFGYNKKGGLINATILWDFTADKEIKIPDLILQDINNKSFNLSSLNGKVYFITFWATWCLPCMREKPELENLKQNLKSDLYIEFIDISFDNTMENWQEYITKHNPIGLQLFAKDKQLTGRKLKFQGIPMHIIVDKESNYKGYHSFDDAKNIITAQLE